MKPAVVLAAGAVLAAFFVAQLATGAALGDTRREAAAAEQALDTATAERDGARAALDERRARAREARTGLEGVQARLDELEVALGAEAGPATASLLAELEGARADLLGATAGLAGRRSEVEALRSCFVSVSQALSLVSLDQRREALDVLGTAAPRCREAGTAR